MKRKCEHCGSDEAFGTVIRLGGMELLPVLCFECRSELFNKIDKVITTFNEEVTG
jgi:hypothetical protein